MSNKLNIIENTLIPHSAFENVRHQLNQCFSYANSKSEPVCIAVIGESRTGKSRSLEETMYAHPAARGREGLDTPILRVTTPSLPTVKGLVGLMLRALGDPLFDKGTEIARTIRLQTLMRTCSTVMVMIDEFQHFYDKGRHKVMHYVADWLKILVDETRVALVVAGLPTCQAVIEQNEQFAGRFIAPIFLPRFDWQREDHREEFCAILAAFHEALSKHYDVPAFHNEELAFRFYCGTGGLMGYLTKFLRQAAWNAHQANAKSISLRDLAVAHDLAMWSKDGLAGMPSPFSRDFQFGPSDALLAAVRQIGTPTPAEVPSRRRGPVRKETAYVSQMLSAT